MQYLITILLALVVSVGSLVGAYNYAPLEPIKLLTPQGEELLGTSITTIQSSDTLKNSRTTINDNFTSLNAGKIEISTTSLPLITTLAGLTTANALTSASALATVGTITSGTWSATAIAVAKGGTGTTSPSLYSVLLGNGANGLTIASGTGTSGQFLTSNGAGAYPSWQSSTVDQTANYTWTGTHNFNATTTLSATTTINSVTVASSTFTQWPSASTSPITRGYLFSEAYTHIIANPDLTDLQKSSDDATSTPQAITSYRKVKEFIWTLEPATITVAFYIYRSGGSGTATGRIYKNGAGVGTERTDTDGTADTYSEDLAFTTGDAIQIYIHGDGNGVTQTGNFRLYFSKVLDNNITITETSL